MKLRLNSLIFLYFTRWLFIVLFKLRANWLVKYIILCTPLLLLVFKETCFFCVKKTFVSFGLQIIIYFTLLKYSDIESRIYLWKREVCTMFLYSIYIKAKICFKCSPTTKWVDFLKRFEMLQKISYDLTWIYDDSLALLLALIFHNLFSTWTRTSHFEFETIINVTVFHFIKI